MERVAYESSPETAIADALLAAPGWARVGIAAPAEHIREAAAIELARAVLDGSERQVDSPDQLRFPL